MLLQKNFTIGEYVSSKYFAKYFDYLIEKHETDVEIVNEMEQRFII